MIQWLSGKKTLIGTLLLSLLGAVYALDLIANDGSPGWMTSDQYQAVGAMIAGLTGAAMRLAVSKVEKKNGS